jgi:hypothetical protein
MKSVSIWPPQIFPGPEVFLSSAREIGTFDPCRVAEMQGGSLRGIRDGAFFAEGADGSARRVSPLAFRIETQPGELLSAIKMREVSGSPLCRNPDRLLDPFRGEWSTAQADAGGVKDGVADGGGDRTNRAFAGAGWRQVGAVERHAVDGVRRVGRALGTVRFCYAERDARKEVSILVTMGQT